MDHLAASRNQVLKALASGEPVSREQAARFPDLVLDPDASRIPDWLLPLIRRPSPPNGPRYVVADGKPFHVSMNAAGPLVTEVELFNSGSVRKVCHNPYAPTPDKVQAAMTAYEAVCKFVRNPDEFRDRFAGIDPSNRAAASPIIDQAVASRAVAQPESLPAVDGVKGDNEPAKPAVTIPRQASRRPHR